MARPRTYKSNGIILKGIPLGEADRIVTIYTPELGKLRLVAKGVRRSRSRMSGYLEPLTYVLISVAEGRTIDTITEVEIIQSFREMREDLLLISKGLYFAELVDKFTVDSSPGTAEFKLLFNGLARLKASQTTDLALRYFEMQMLKITGFGPEINQCIECHNELEIDSHGFSNSKGGILGSECRSKFSEPSVTISVSVIKLLRYLQNESYDRVMGLNMSDGLQVEVEKLLGSYIRYVLDKKIKSKEFIGLLSS